jgi:hypothetical protein
MVDKFTEWKTKNAESNKCGKQNSNSQILKSTYFRTFIRDNYNQINARNVLLDYKLLASTN